MANDNLTLGEIVEKLQVVLKKYPRLSGAKVLVDASIYSSDNIQKISCHHLLFVTINDDGGIKESFTEQEIIEKDITYIDGILLRSDP